MTRWQSSPHVLGGYSTYFVGTKWQMFDELAKPINDRLWFIGEHTNSEENYYIQGAYYTGERAAY